MIYVTHDQTEALTFADQVIVMYAGPQSVQIGQRGQQLFETAGTHLRWQVHWLAGDERILPCADRARTAMLWVGGKKGWRL